jgi:anthranilate phosphoribosyltransferase
MKYAIGPRRELGIRTLFNLLGPLTNPAGAPNQLLGIHAGHQQVEDMAEVMRQLGSQHVLVVNAEDGLDEISIAASTRVAELKDGQIISYHVTPEQFGLKRSPLSDIAVDTVGASLHMMKQVLQGQPGAARDITLLNAGAAIYAANLCSDMAGGITMAATVIDSGAAREKLDALIRISQSFHPSRSSHH